MRHRKWIYFLIVVAAMAAVLEVAARIILKKLDKGYHCFEIKQVVPQAPIVAHSGYGYYLNNGTYSYYNECGLVFKATHSNNERFTPAADTGTNKAPVLVFGDSNIYGYGVEDTCTLPYYLQQWLPGYRLHNMGVPGWSALVSYTRLLNYLGDSANAKPALVIFQLASYDGGRITLTPLFLNAYKSRGVAAQSYQLPYGYLQNGKLATGTKTIDNRISRIYELSAVVTLVTKLYLSKVSFTPERNSNGTAVTKALMHNLAEVCKSNHVPLLIAGYDISNEDAAYYKQQYNAPAQNLYFTNISSKSNDVSYTLLPYDNHPSAKGQLHNAKALLQAISTLLP